VPAGGINRHSDQRKLSLFRIGVIGKVPFHPTPLFRREVLSQHKPAAMG
jgi:hypothetical protein